jgi:hypothetical protein
MKPMVRTLLFSIPLILIGFSSLSQIRDFRTQELYFKKLYDRATNTPEDKNELRDSLFTQFGEEFIRFIKKNPGAIDYPFKDLSSIIIQSSDDKVLRIYSWDDGSGGSMRFFNQIIQYRSEGKVYTHTPKRIQEGDPGEYCSQIFHLKAGTRNLYLPINNIIGSTKDRAESISCFTI